MKIIGKYWYDDEFSWRIWRIGWFREWERTCFYVAWGGGDESEIANNFWVRIFLGLYFKK